MRCEEVRKYLPADSDSGEVTGPIAEQVAEHLDACPRCERLLGAVLDGALKEAAPAVRTDPVLARKRSAALRVRLAVAGVAALFLAALGIGYVRTRPPPAVPAAPVVQTPAPPRFEDLEPAQRHVLLSQGALAQYGHFVAYCINSPQDTDARTFLQGMVKTLREARASLARADESGRATFEAFNDALGKWRDTAPASIRNLPSRLVEIDLSHPARWSFLHELSRGQLFRLTIARAPDYLNAGYLRIALEADEAQAARIEETVWIELYREVYLEAWKGLSDRDSYLLPRVERALFPHLSPRQREIFRKIAD